MNALRRYLFTLCVLACAGRAQATTWDEPWHREVVSGATSFGLYEVVQSTPEAVTLKLVKHLAGETTGASVDVKGFYALRLTSQFPGHAPGFRFRPGSRAYFYLKRTGTTWALATPTAGYAGVQASGKVAATYRISPHQALVDAPLYEDTQRCIFQALHGETCAARVGAFVEAELAKPVERMTDASTNDSLAGFFRQHAALETAAIMRYPVSAATLDRYLATPGMHVQMSALRVLAVSDRPDKAAQLMAFVEDDEANMQARVLAAVLLRELGAHGMKARLQGYAPRASTTQAGLGVNLMDPRIGTRFPHTLREAVELAGKAL
jgi:hypothetical protein